MLSARPTSLRLGRSARSAPELALPAAFRDRKPTSKPKAPPPPPQKVDRKKKVNRKYKILNSKKLKIECFIDDGWHLATILDGDSHLYLKGVKYLIKYVEDGYKEWRMCDDTMRLPA